MSYQPLSPHSSLPVFHVIPSSTLSGGPLGWLRAWKTIREGRAAASRLYESFHPSVVVGFGGYPVLPAMLAARQMGIATVIHETNSELGRANRPLAGQVDLIAHAYAEGKRMPPATLA